MRYPQLVILESDGWVAKQLGELVNENQWLVRQPRKSADVLAVVREPCPTVLVVQVEPADDSDAVFSLIADAHRLSPDVPVVAVSDVKMPDADRAAWTAVLLDLGARYVLFPPLSRPVLEDVISGLMAATIRRVMGSEPPPPAEPRVPGLGEAVIDLADEEVGG